MKIRVVLIMLLIFVCESSALNARIIRQENSDKVSYLDTDDKIEVSFDKKADEYAIQVNSVELKDIWAPEFAKKTFFSLQDMYVSQECQRFEELLTPQG